MATHAWPDWKRWRERDRQLAVALNHIAGDASVMRFYRGVSRLGDGMLWYALMAALPVVGGDTGWECAKQMGLTGLLSLVIYILLKRGVCRPRPYLSCEEIHLCGRVLDQFSFPSGHTLHAVSFSIVMAAYYPRMALALAPFTLMVALSRVILGLHYPSDVLAGAGLGVLIGGLSVWLF